MQIIAHVNLAEDEIADAQDISDKIASITSAQMVVVHVHEHPKIAQTGALPQPEAPPAA